MGHELVKIIEDFEGKELDGFWHLTMAGDGKRVLCDGLAIDDGGVIFERKIVKRGGITCPNCMAMLREFKSIKL